MTKKEKTSDEKEVIDELLEKMTSVQTGGVGEKRTKVLDVVRKVTESANDIINRLANGEDLPWRDGEFGVTQRYIAENTGYQSGQINQILRSAVKSGPIVRVKMPLRTSDGDKQVFAYYDWSVANEILRGFLRKQIARQSPTSDADYKMRERLEIS